ncbi:MAG: YfhO family protein [Parvicellaceae bacterium]
MKTDLKRFLPHVIAVVTLLVIAMVYFSPALSDYRVFQSDIQQHKGMSNEVVDFRDEFDSEPLWTNSMFGGMPATQISVVYESNLLRHVNSAIQLGLPHPINVFFLYMLGFYIFLLCLRVNPWLALVGAIAYGFSSYFFIIIDVGHNSKAMAMAYMAPALGGFLMALRGKKFLGTAIFTLFVALQIGANHPQVTYYLFLFLGVVFVYEMIRYLLKKDYKSLITRISLLAIGSLFAISTSIPNLYGTYEYSKFSQRAGTELVSEQQLEKKSNDNYKSRALMWSYGKGESWSFLIPNIKGGGDASLAQNEDFQNVDKYDDLKQFLQLQGINEYWGNQPGTSGPVYIGAIICFLFFLGMIFWKNNLKWPILFISLIALFLSWGKNMEWFTDIFWNYLPLYKNLRAVTIILVLLELTFCVVAFLWLNDALKNRSWWEEKFSFLGRYNSSITNKKMFLFSSSFFGFILLLFTLFPSLFFDMLSERELNGQFNTQTFVAQRDQQARDDQFLQENKVTKDQLIAYYNQSIIPLVPKAKIDLQQYRQTVVSSSAGRSLLLIAISFVVLLFCFNGKIPSNSLYVVIAVLFLVDMWPIAREYLNNDEGVNRDYKHWQKEDEKLMPLIASAADRSILTNEIIRNPDLGSRIKDYLDQKTNASDVSLAQREIDRITFGKLNRLTNYRVLNVPSGVFQETSTSYFHKSLGGYHSAKIQRYQDLIDTLLPYEIDKASQFNTLDIPILNMLNAKYIILNANGGGAFVNSITDVYSMNREQQSQMPGILNDNRLGNAWFVSEVKGFSNPNQEFNALKSFDPSSYAITDTSYEFNKNIVGSYLNDSSLIVQMTDYSANKISYSITGLESKNPSDNFFVVFSEVYYSLGWKAKVDDKEMEINRVNYTLRGLKIPGGAKKIELYYELESFKSLSAVALTSSTAILLLVFGFFYLSVFKNKDD